MIAPRRNISSAHQAMIRLTGTRKMIASAQIAHIKDNKPDPARWTPQERIAIWTAEAMARRPLR